MLTAALFTIAKTWKQAKCPLADEWIKKMWYTHTHTQRNMMQDILTSYNHFEQW